MQSSYAHSDAEKAEMFGSTLKKIFSNEPVESFDKENMKTVKDYLSSNRNKLFETRVEDNLFDSDFSMQELEEGIKTLKIKSAPGNDGIKNFNLTNLSTLGKIHCLRIFNKSWNSGILIEDWKTAEVKMIKKKDNDLSNPMNYRPISLTKCIGKLMGKLIKRRLVYFLDKYNLISIYQSGFR